MPIASTSASIPTAPPDRKGKRKAVDQDPPRAKTKSNQSEQHSPKMDKVVPVPTAETPKINRNAAMRRGDDSGRRTSVERRGRRASSIGSGFEGKS